MESEGMLLRHIGDEKRRHRWRRESLCDSFEAQTSQSIEQKTTTNLLNNFVLSYRERRGGGGG